MSEHATTVHGVVAAPVTPFTDDDRVDTGVIQRLADFLVRERADVIIPLMHIGENLKLSEAERRTVAEATVEAVDGRVPVYVHVSTGGTGLSVDEALHVEKLGADGVMLLPPYLWKPSPSTVIEHFRTVAGAISGGVVAYNNPGRTGVSITPEMFGELLAACPNLVAMKDATFHMGTFTELCRIGRARERDVAMLTGVEYVLPAAAVGAHGTVSVLGAVAPRLVRALVDRSLAGDLEPARDLQFRLSELLAIRHRHPEGPQTIVKAMLEIMGRPCGGLRQPAPTMSGDERAMLESKLASLGLLDTEPHGW